jgi:Tol biopolymer transport system component/peroxiredoxin
MVVRTWSVLLSIIVANLLLVRPTRGGDEQGPTDAVPFKHKLILEELNGGTDSAVSPDGEWLTFSSRRSGNLDIWIMHTETGKTRQITSNPATDNEARWSPDGKQLCFVTQRSGSQDVYVVDLETGKETPIATQPYNEDYPSFSQDGSEIVFTGGPRGFREVQVYNFASGKIRTITRGFGYVGSANFSPDGKQIVFHAYYDNNYNSGKSDVYIVPSEGGKPVNVTRENTIWNYKPCWSFCGNFITYSSKRSTPNFNLWSIRPDGTDRRSLTSVQGTDLRWSNWTKDGRIGWHQVNPQTGRVRAIDLATGTVNDMQTSDFHIRDLTVSPDGKQLLYETDFQIYVTDARPGAEPRAVASGVAPRWSPDGRSISYLVDRRSKIRILPLNGGDERTVDITPSSWPEASTSGWSADGISLAVVTGDRDRSSLVVVTADGTRRTLVENSELKSSAIWSSDGKTIFYAENHPATVGYYISTEPVTDLAAKAASRRDHLPDPAEVIVRESSAAPPFALNDLNGDPVRLASIDAPFTVLYFWSTSRECESDLQALSQLNERFASQGVAVLSLSYSSGTPEQIRRFLDTLDVNLPTLMCSKRVCDDYGVAVFPTTFVLDRNHRIRDWKYGVQIDEHWQQLFDSMLASD